MNRSVSFFMFIFSFSLANAMQKSVPVSIIVTNETLGEITYDLRLFRHNIDLRQTSSCELWYLGEKLNPGGRKEYTSLSNIKKGDLLYFTWTGVWSERVKGSQCKTAKCITFKATNQGPQTEIDVRT